MKVRPRAERPTPVSRRALLPRRSSVSACSRRRMGARRSPLSYPNAWKMRGTAGRRGPRGRLTDSTRPDIKASAVTTVPRWPEPALFTGMIMPDENLSPAAGAISRNPASGELIATYPFHTPEEVERTLAMGSAAYQRWRATPMADRVGCYRRLAAALRERSEALALVVTSEMGKTIRSARAEVEKCAATLEWLAEHGPAILADEPVEADGGDRVYVSFLPIGTVLAVMPWNFPLWQVI